jgi:hypothetical protein
MHVYVCAKKRIEEEGGYIILEQHDSVCVCVCMNDEHVLIIFY